MQITGTDKSVPYDADRNTSLNRDLNDYFHFAFCTLHFAFYLTFFSKIGIIKGDYPNEVYLL